MAQTHTCPNKPYDIKIWKMHAFDEWCIDRRSDSEDRTLDQITNIGYCPYCGDELS